jgi:hypothetical protein
MLHPSGFRLVGLRLPPELLLGSAEGEQLVVWFPEVESRRYPRIRQLLVVTLLPTSLLPPLLEARRPRSVASDATCPRVSCYVPHFLSAPGLSQSTVSEPAGIQALVEEVRLLRKALEAANGYALRPPCSLLSLRGSGGGLRVFHSTLMTCIRLSPRSKSVSTV